jgi:hypothetical protein
MVDEAELIREHIATLQEYIEVLEKLRSVWLGFRLSAPGRAVLDRLDHKIGWAVHWLAGAAGLAMFFVALGLGRFIARSPAAWLILLAAAAGLAVGAVVLIFHLARRRAANLEIRRAQLEIFRLERQLDIQ